MPAPQAFWSFLNSHKLVSILAELNAFNEQQRVVAARQSGRCATAEFCEQYDMLLSLRATCREARAAAPLIDHVYNRLHDKGDIASFLVTRGAGAMPCDLHSLVQFPDTLAFGNTSLWQITLSKMLSVVDLAKFCGTPELGVPSAEVLPLDENARLFPNMRSLVVGDGWHGAKKFSGLLQIIIEKCLPCSKLKELKLFAKLSDAAPILAIASGSPITSLSITSPSGDRPGCRPEDRLSAAMSIGSFTSLRVLAVPSLLMHRFTAHYFASLPSLEVLRLSSRLVLYGEWRQEEQERDDWSGMHWATGGFPQLRDLHFDGIAADQLAELTGPGRLPSVESLALHHDSTRQSLDEYCAAFGALGSLCTGVRQLSLRLAPLNDQQLQVAVKSVWPSATVAIQECNCAFVNALI